MPEAPKSGQPVSPPYGDLLDPQFGEAIVRAASRNRTWLRIPEFDHARPKGAAWAGMAAAVRDALVKAGYREKEDLADFRLADLGGMANKIGLRDLDLIHRENVAAAYGKLGFKDSAAIELLADQRILPWDAIGFIRKCGNIFKPPGKFLEVIPDLEDLREKLIAEFDLRFDHQGPPLGGPPPSWTDPADPHIDMREIYDRADLLDAKTREALSPNSRRAQELLEKPLEPGTIGEALVQAQLLDAHGDTALAKRLAVHAGRADRNRLTPLEQYQADVVAPAVVLSGSLANSPLIYSSADAALKKAVPGTSPAMRAARAAMRASRRDAARRMKVSAPSNSPSGMAASLMAERDLLGTLTGARLEKESRANSTIAMQSSAALLDVMRAAAAAITVGAAPGRLLNPQDTTSKSKLLPENGAAFLVGPGGLGSLVDPAIKANALGVFHTLHSSPFSPAFLDDLASHQGDLFRFDFLLDEARRLLDDIARIEGLLFNLTDMLLEQGLALVSAITDDVTDVLAQLINALTAKIAKLGQDIFGLVNELLPKLRDAAFLKAVVDILSNWPHDNWIALFSGTRSKLQAGEALHDAVYHAMYDMLKNDIVASLDDIADQLESHLDALTQQIKDIALPEELKNKLKDFLDAAGVSNVDDSVLQPLEDALHAIDLRGVVQPLIDQIREATDIPPWAVTLLLIYVVAPFIAAIAEIIIPIMLALAIGGPLILLALGSIVVGALAIDALELLVLDAIFAFLMVAATQYIVSLVLQFSTNVLGLVADMQREADLVKDRTRALVDKLIADLANLGGLQALLDAALIEIGAITDQIQGLLPKEVAQALHDSLVGARTVIEDDLRSLLCALERSFFRETLELVDAVNQTTAPILPLDGKIAGFADQRLGSTGQFASALSAFESTRIERALDPPQVLTHVFSMRQLIGMQGVFFPDLPGPPPAGTMFTQLLNGLPLPFSITATALDTLMPGMHRALIKDVQVQIDFDLNSPGFDDETLAQIPLTDVVTTQLQQQTVIDVNKTVAAVAIASGGGAGSTDAEQIITDGLTSPVIGVSSAVAAGITEVLTQGLDNLGIAAGALTSQTGLTLEEVLLRGLDTGNLHRLELLNISLADAIIAALATAGVHESAKHISLLDVVKAGLAALASQASPISGLTIARVIRVGFEALDIEQATGRVVDAARKLTGEAADPALDGRIPGGGFPGLPVVAGRIPTGLPLVLKHNGPSRVRLLPSQALTQAYIDSCDDPTQSCYLPCALRHTRLITDDSNPEAQDAGWQYLEFDDHPATQLFSHFQILKDGVRFIVPEKEVKPFEYRGLIGDWSLQIPALVNSSVEPKLPPIRDIRLIVSTVAHYDDDLKTLVKQPLVTLPEPPAPALPLAPIVPAIAPAAEDLPALLDELRDTIEAALDALNAQLGSAVGNLATVIDAALADVTTELGRVRTGVDGLLDVSQILAAVSTQLAAVTGVVNPSTTIKFLTLNGSDLSSLTGSPITWSISNATLTSQSVDPGKVQRVVAVSLVPVPVATAGILGGVTFPTGTGSLSTPAGNLHTISLVNGSETLPISEATPVGNWSITLPTGMPELSDFLIGVFLEVLP